MKKHTEKQPIDDLFAHKLSNMSLQPSSTGWEVLQERMGQRPVRRIVPVWYRYAAAAACLVVVAGFGWLAWPNAGLKHTAKEQVAAKSTKAQKTNPLKSITGQLQESIATEKADQLESTDLEKVYAVNEQVSNQQMQKPGITKGSASIEVKVEQQPPVEAIYSTVVPSTESVIAKASQSVEKNTEMVDQQPDKKSIERTLIVTIAAPTVSLAANQTVEQKHETLMSALNDDVSVKEEKPTKAARFFRKLKQLKDGNEAMAYNSNKNDEDEESGLISRLYGNVKHSIDSKKAEKR